MRFYFLILVFAVFSCKEYKENSTVTTLAERPNVILILADDLGYQDVGFNGSTDIKTPNLDRLAYEGAKFTNAYVTYAVCGPSRAGIMTGRYQDRFGFSRNPLFTPKDSLSGLPLEEKTLAEVLKTANYSTMAIGKWHLGAHVSQRPLKRGFDQFYGFLSGGHKYFPEELVLNDISEVSSQFDAYNTKLLRNDVRVEETEYLTDAFSREAVEFINKEKNNPFFLYLAYNAPHSPLQATSKYLSRYSDIKDEKRKTYAAMVSALDDGVGKILNELEKNNIDKNTLIIFLSDNGGDESKGANNGILSKGKGSLYEGGIRVPFAMYWKGKIDKNTVYEEPVSSLDIFSTAVDLAQVKTNSELDGQNLISLLSQTETKTDRELYWRMYDKDAYAIRNSEHKLLFDKNGNLKVFKISTDISEATPIQDSVLHNQLQEQYDEWNLKNEEPRFLGLMQNRKYNAIHPERYENVEKY